MAIDADAAARNRPRGTRSARGQRLDDAVFHLDADGEFFPQLTEITVKLMQIERMIRGIVFVIELHSDLGGFGDSWVDFARDRKDLAAAFAAGNNAFVDLKVTEGGLIDLFNDASLTEIYTRTRVVIWL